jgi:hypothetical protein
MRDHADRLNPVLFSRHPRETGDSAFAGSIGDLFADAVHVDHRVVRAGRCQLPFKVRDHVAARKVTPKSHLNAGLAPAGKGALWEDGLTRITGT